MKIIVLVKQVPDTRNVGPEAMTPEGTVNRSALPAVFNPDDLKALEVALRIREQHGGSVTVISMGLPKAEDVLREGMYRGADDAVLLTDRRLGGADTLATSYTLAQAIRKIGVPDLILCGRQAIDGDTAQVGPQVAEKLGLPQLTYVEEVSVSIDMVRARRHIDGGVETVECRMPCLLTVGGNAPQCRSRNVRRVMACKRKVITQWNAQDIDADPRQIGKAGSPTNVKAVRSVVYKAKESKTLTAADEDIKWLVCEIKGNFN